MNANTAPALPWYKQPWPWILIAIPFTSICVGSYYMYQAIHGADPMVQEQYYAAGQSINKVIEAGRTAQKMGLSAQLNFASQHVTLTLANPQHQPLPPVLSLQLSHPTVVNLDQTVTLVASAEGQYTGVLKPSNASRWDVTLAAPDQKWSLSGSWNSSEGSQIPLTPTDLRKAEN